MWLSVALQADAKRAEALSDALMNHGAVSVSIEDADAGTEAEKPQFGEPGMEPASLWDHSRVIALFESDCDLTSALSLAAGEAGLEQVPAFTVEEIEDQNWVQLTQSQFDPIRITDRLWIVPSWHEAPNSDAINIELDPGMAFGTGSHPTTHLCLEWLEQTVTPGCSVMDYGCGSGILAIAAARLGAGSVKGVDIDEKAVDAARDNATRNGVNIEAALSTQAVEGQYDLVVANILTNPLRVLAPALCALVAPGGRIALSGILESQTDQVIEAYAPWISLHVGKLREGWARLEGVRA